MKFLFNLASLLVFCGISTAQDNGKIAGRLQTENSTPPLPLSLISATDGSLVKTALTDTDGQFSFDHLAFGSYLILMEDPAFQAYTSEIIVLNTEHPERILPSVELIKKSVQQLDEVSISTKKPVVENKIDRVVVNVESMLSAAGGDALDVLEKSPGITVDQDGRITFKGKSGVAVFLDGKPSYLSGSELEAYLRSLPASTLSQIELMTNPPAQFDAAGSAGVINIVTKKSKTRGLNGSFNARAQQGKRFRNRENISLNYHDDRFRISGNLGFDYFAAKNDLTIYRRFQDDNGATERYFDQNSLLENRARSGNARFGMDYYLSEKTTIGLNVSGILRGGDSDSDVNSVLRNADFALDSTVVARNRNATDFANVTTNVNMRHDFSEQTRLTADADYLFYDTQTDQQFRNFIYRPDGSLKNDDLLLGTLPSRIDIVSLKTDFSHTLSGGTRLETGYKISSSKTDNVADYRNWTDAGPVPDYDQSNHFRYDETIQAAYVNASGKVGRFSLQAGLRFEATDSRGHQLGNPEKPADRFHRRYENLFPTAFVQYALDSLSDHSLVASYGKRINRPFYQDLNPFVSPLDRFTYYGGNPYLNPSFAHNMELSYRYKGIFSTTASYGFSKDDINETIEIQDGIYYSRPGNIGKSRFYSLNANLQTPLTGWWSTQVYSEVTHAVYQSTLYDQTLNSNGTFWVANTTNSFTLAPTWTAELSGYYQTDVTSSQFLLRSRGGMNLAVQKKILAGKGSLRLIVNDLFYTNIYRGVINNLAQTRANWINRPDSRFVALAFTYSFGKAFQPRSSHDADGAQSEADRVRS